MTWFLSGLMALAAVVVSVWEIAEPGHVARVVRNVALFVAIWLVGGVWAGKIGVGLPGLAAALTFYFLIVLLRMARRP